MKSFLVTVLVFVVGCAPTTQPAQTTPQPPRNTSSTLSPAATTTVILNPSTTSQATTTSSLDSAELNIMFVGNSHTSTHNVPAIVENLLESTGDDVNVALFGASFLRHASGDTDILDAIASGDWDIVVLQVQEISQSHTIAYSQEEAISLAESAIAASSRPLFLSEWNRRGHEETAYIEGIYQEMAEAAGAEVIPVGQAWDLFLETNPGYELWATDGNHSSPDGAFLAAATIALFIAGPEAGITAEPDRISLLNAAQAVIAEYVGG